MSVSRYSAAAYGIKAPGILLIKRNDAIRPRVVFSGDFSPSNIVDFVRVNSLKSFVSVQRFAFVCKL